jgi:D-3-phosphoglycerate dehydrogenase
VVRFGVGYDKINIKALSDRNIIFCNTPDYGTEEVADTACAMLFNLHRKIASHDRACRYFESGWQDNVLAPIQRSSDTSVGIIGVGRIGTAVVNRLKAFGFEIFGYDPYQPSGHEKAIGYIRTHSIKELLKKSQFVSLHCPLTEETRGLVDREFLSQMKPGASLINTARGGIISDLGVIEEALKSGHLASAALDVLPDEPPKDNPLILAWRNDEPWIQGRLFINPHTAFYSERAWYEMRYKTAETARLYLLEGIVRNRIVE